ncbi:MAG: SurA N-terminal domain-containing protein [Candidatus Omnitrophica bacterium]|jgi:peptidyl-prolyl cis-trans isomerase D|nr:SurA N-terminal domain-containing protein [Candidatus Omnitrophota bacterium]
MLKVLRKKETAKKIWIVLAILILPAFVLWGSGSMVSNKQEAKFAGEINGEKIPIQEFQESLDAVKNRALIQFGDKFSEVEKSLDLPAQAWDRLVILKEAQKRKIKTSDNEVVTSIESYPFFQSMGTFDKRIYAQMLTYVFRVQARVFEEQTRQNLMLAKLFQQVTSGVSLKDADILEEYKKANEETSIYYIAGLAADFTKDSIIDDKELNSYFSKNSLKFKQPLSFNVEYVEIALQDQVKKIYSRLLRKEPFEKVAKENNLTLKETGIFSEAGPVPGLGWSPEVLKLIIEAKPEQYLPPLALDKSYYILRLKERKEPYIPDFNAIKDKAKDALLKDRAQVIAKEKMENCLKALKEFSAANLKGVDFEKTAKIFSLKYGATDKFKYSSYIENIGASDQFWAAASKLKEGEFSEIIEMPSGFYIIKVKTKSSFDKKKFEAEKAEFSQKLLEQAKQEQFLKFVAELKKQAQSRF